jgi:hypothetical protein
MTRGNRYNHIGARESQILTVSYGETRPRGQGHDEDA